MPQEYAQQRDGNIYIGASRVTLPSIIAPWCAGETPEMIQVGYPSLTLAQVYGTIARYLEHQAELDVFLEETRRRWAEQRAASAAADPEFHARLRKRFTEARAHMQRESAGPSPADEAAYEHDVPAV